MPVLLYGHRSMNTVFLYANTNINTSQDDYPTWLQRIPHPAGWVQATESERNTAFSDSDTLSSASRLHHHCHHHQHVKRLSRNKRNIFKQHKYSKCKKKQMSLLNERGRRLSNTSDTFFSNWYLKHGNELTENFTGRLSNLALQQTQHPTGWIQTNGTSESVARHCEVHYLQLK